MISDLINKLYAIECEPSAEVVADALWMLNILASSLEDISASYTVTEQSRVEPIKKPVSTDERPQRRDQAPISSRSEPPDSKNKDEPSTEIFPVSDNQSNLSEVAGVLIQAPGAPALDDHIEIAKSLRLFAKRIPSLTHTTLNIDATILRAQGLGVLVPILQPLHARWLSLHLVFDSSSSLDIWYKVTHEIRDLFLRLGAFRSIRLWSLDAEDPDAPFAQVAPMMKNGVTHMPRSPGVLIDPTGRSIILVVSDCVAPGWWSGAVAKTLELWGRSGSTAILQLLPQRLWSRSSLGHELGAMLRSIFPVAPNASLKARIAGSRLLQRRGVLSNVKVPVLTLDAHSFGVWAQMVAGKPNAQMPGILFSTNRREAIDTIKIPEATRIERFLATTSPMGVQLARLLAGAGVISLPIIRVIQREAIDLEIVSQSDYSHVVEIFLGGLLYTIVEADDPEAVLYDFIPGVREQLLQEAHQGHTIFIYDLVSNYIARNAGGKNEYAAIAASPFDVLDHLPIAGRKAFASATVSVLRDLGERELAEAIQQVLRNETISTVPELRFRGRALLIGVGSWEHLTIPNSQFTAWEAETIASALRDSQACRYPAEQVTLLTHAQATRTGVLDALNQLADQSDEDDIIFIQYSGHWDHTTDSQSCLTTHDTRGVFGAFYTDTVVTAEELIAVVKRIRARNILLSFTASNPSIPTEICEALVRTGNNHLVLVDTTPGDHPYFDQEKGTTLLGTHFSNTLYDSNLPNRNGYISVFDLFAQIRRRVMTEAHESFNKEQKPVLFAQPNAQPFPIALHRDAEQLEVFVAPLEVPDGIYWVEEVIQNDKASNNDKKIYSRSLTIDNPAGVDLPPDTIQVLRRLFTRYKRVIILKEFTGGLSGSRVFEVRPIKVDGTPELPTMVKLASASTIQQEWRAYREHIHNRMPNIASVAARPTVVTATGWGGLRYPVVGIGHPDVLNLQEFCFQPDVSADELQAVLERLFRIMDNVWGYNVPTPLFAIRSSYDTVLPPQLLAQIAPLPPDASPLLITPEQLPIRELQPGDWVQLEGFAVGKVDPSTRIVTFEMPGSISGGQAFRARLHIPEAEPMPAYEVQQIVNLPAACVIETCASRLQSELAALEFEYETAAPMVALSEDMVVANPLHSLEELLNQSRSVNVATIHGDFNLNSVLIEPHLGDINLIDFAEARQDHVLHDLLHLEVAIMTHILPNAIHQSQLDPVLVLAELSRQLHKALRQPGSSQNLPQHPLLHKPWVMLQVVRRTARRYLFHVDDPTEYYHGLILYLLGALRFKNLNSHPDHPLPKRIAFWSATLAYQWFLCEERVPPPVLEPLLARSEALWRDVAYRRTGSVPQRVVQGQPVLHANVHGDDLLAALPEHQVPPIGRLPNGSRMLLERNARFVGRQEQLKQIATALKQRVGLQNGAVAIAGLGGIGKTQLASEFAHRFGRFFVGGVFWLSCADPQAIMSEIAACGGQDALDLRPDFHELSLDQQVQLVLAAWQQPAPRLLIFDDCESLELMMRWWPQGGGSRVLVTSRRTDWERVGILTVGLDVLRRQESLALLREHLPDTDGEPLGNIAHELGDLPLALHLAGSYLARYRHVIDPASYLESVRQSSPLHHQLLQGGTLSLTEHDSHVARTLAISYDQLSDDDPTIILARRLLHSAACMMPGEAIPQSLARLVLNAQYDDAIGAAQAGFQIGSAIDQLLDLGLIRTEANHMLWVHRLVVAFSRERLGKQLVDTQAVVARILGREAERLNALREPAALRAWQVHLRYVVDAALPYGDTAAADLCHTLGEHLYQIGEYQGASRYHEQALQIRTVVFGAEHPTSARSMTQLGKVLIYCGELGRARSCLEQAITIQERQGDDQQELATSFNHMGFLLQMDGDYEQARHYHLQALALRRTIHGAQHPAIIDSLSNLAYLEYAQDNLAQAQVLLHQALDLQRLATGDEHPETARLLTNMGELLLAQQKHQEAQQVLHQALTIQEHEFGTLHLQTARTLDKLGETYRWFGDLSGARYYYQQALDVFVSFYGSEHQRTQEAMEQLNTLALWESPRLSDTLIGIKKRQKEGTLIWS